MNQRTAKLLRRFHAVVDPKWPGPKTILDLKRMWNGLSRPQRGIRRRTMLQMMAKRISPRALARGAD